MHTGAVRDAIHAFKYHGVDRIAEAMAPVVGELLPKEVTALVPIPRSTVRRIRFGIDQSRTLARVVGALCDVPVIDALRASPLHRSQLLGRTHGDVRFRRVQPIPLHSVLIDDVVTTGTTIQAAASVCEPAIRYAVTISRSTFSEN